MIKLENTEVVGWEHAILGMRNPMNSWGNSDSGYCLGSLACHACHENRNFCKGHIDNHDFVIGQNDKNLMKRLRQAGTDHRKFMRMIAVYVDITAPLYWWKEFDTYKVGTVTNSCSTMHKIHAKKFTLDDFSHEHIIDDWVYGACCITENHDEAVSNFNYAFLPMESNFNYAFLPMDVLNATIRILNVARELYLDTKDKKYWWQMIQLLPSSYNQKRTVMLNYEVLANMYKSRKDHKLDEWHHLCDWAKALPYSELITGQFENEY